MIPFAITMFALIVIGLVLLFRLLPHMKPNSKRIKQDLQEMQTDMNEWLDQELVPIRKEELELFSFNQMNRLVKKRITLRARGVFTTIYDEPVLAYAYKRYVGSGRNALLYARTADHHFAYWIKNKEIQMLIDNKLVGVLRNDGVLYNERKRPIASIQQSQEELAPVVVHDREVASLVKTDTQKSGTLSPRAFQFVKKDINEEEEKLFLALATLELVRESVPKK
jgi:hypothetical protein